MSCFGSVFIDFDLEQLFVLMIPISLISNIILYFQYWKAITLY